MQDMKSVEALVEADISRPSFEDEKPVKKIPEKIDGMTNMEVVVRELVRKEIEYQKALKEIQRLKDWISKIREVNKKERAVMHYNMGCIFRFYKRYQKAEEEFIKAMTLDPLDASVHYNLGVLYEDDLKDREKAKQHYRKFLELSNDETDRATVQEWLSSLQ